VKRLFTLLAFTGLFSLVSCSKRAEIEIVIAGNSIPAGIENLPFQQTLMQQLGPRYGLMANIAVSGQSTANMLKHDPALIDKSLAWRPAKLILGNRPAVLVAWEGTNDLSELSQNGKNQGQRAFDDTRTYFEQEKATWPKLRTVTATVLPRTNPDIKQPTFERERLIYNNLLRQAVAKHEPWLDELADVAADSSLIKPGPSRDGSESKMYHDYVHLSEAGIKMAVKYFKPAIERAAAK
jgi:hypothetical protein